MSRLMGMEMCPARDRRGTRLRRALAVGMCLAVLGTAESAAAQQTIGDALTFLLTGRPLPIDSFVPTVPPGRSPADALTLALRHELVARPITSPAGGLAYEWNSALGIMVRPTDSFGPIFVSRARAAGIRRASLSFSLRQVEFDAVDGLSLTGDRLIAAASSVAGETTPFDVQSVDIRLRARTATFTGHIGVADRLDFIVAVPFIDLRLSGDRIDTYRETVLPQATASASASGLGDVVMRGQYQLVRDGPRSLAVAGQVRLPTGNTENSLGTGERALTPSAVGSIELRRFTAHAELGYSFGARADAVHYVGAVTVAPAARVTLTGELLGRTDFDAPSLGQVTVSHAQLAGVSTALLTGTTTTTHRLTAVVGIKWNVADALLLNAHLLHPLTEAGFTTQWAPAITVDYFFQQ